VQRGACKSIGFNKTSFKRIENATPRFEDFDGRQCVMTGSAMKGGIMMCGKESARMVGLAEWPETILGKKVVVRGRLLHSGSDWRWLNSTWTPAELTDMLGQQVALIGALWSNNGVWWFERENVKERICLTSGPGPVLTFDTHLYHGTAARVTGKLARQMRPSLEQIGLKADRDLVPQFTVRDARVEHLIPVGRSWEYDWIHGKPQAMRNGIPLLVDELALVPGLVGNETKSSLCILYNSAAIKHIQSDRSSQMTEFLTARMNESDLSPTLKLVHACVLAARDDERGRAVLRAQVAHPESPTFPDAVHCLFEFPFLPADESKAKPQTAWVEEIFLKLISDDERKCVTNNPVYSNENEVRNLTPAAALFAYSSALKWLQLLPSAHLRKVMVDCALSKKWGELEMLRDEVIDALCADPAPLDSKTLRRFVALRMKTEPWSVGQVVTYLSEVVKKHLKQNDPSLLPQLQPLLGELSDRDWFREGLTPEFAVALDKMADGLAPADRLSVRRMLVLREPNPVGKLLALLNDAEWTDKSGVVWELSHFKDKRVIQPLLVFLIKLKGGAFAKEDDLRTSYAIQHAISAISAAGGDEAISALVSLLSMDFGRAGASYMNDEGLHRIVAAKLINMTGESFGLDAEAWTRWLESR